MNQRHQKEKVNVLFFVFGSCFVGNVVFFVFGSCFIVPFVSLFLQSLVISTSCSILLVGYISFYHISSIHPPSLPPFLPPFPCYRSVRCFAPPPFTALATSTATTLQGASSGPATPLSSWFMDILRSIVREAPSLRQKRQRSSMLL